MRTDHGAALILCALAFTACAAGSPAARPNDVAPVQSMAPGADPVAQRLDSLLRAVYPADAPGAAVLVRRGERVLLRGGYGMADLELGVPIQPEHVFRIGSVTKQFTAAAILKLAEQGKLSVDDEITGFLPDWPTHGQRITVGALLSHTAGIANYTSLPRWRPLWRVDMTRDSLMGLFRPEPLDFNPGERWSYSNSGYVLLGAIIDKVSGRSYEEYVEQELFAPLGLTRTRYGRNDELVPGRVEGYQRGPNGWVPAPYLSLTQPYAAGSILSTVDDLDRWIGALQEGRVLSSASLQRAWTPVRLKSGLSSGYGYGWMPGRAFGQRTLEHSGGIHGFATFQLWLPDPDIRVFVLTNSGSPTRPPGAVALELARIALGSPAWPTPVALAPDQLNQYLGAYRASEGETRQVLRRADSLFIRIGNTGGTAPLVPVGRDTFVVAASQNTIIFERPSGGPVTGLLFQPRTGVEAREPRLGDVPADEPTVSVPPEVLERYVGTYQLASDFELVVTREGNRLITQATNQPSIEVRPVSQTEFIPVGVNARIVFQVGADGRASALTLHQGGRSMNAPRTK